MLTEEQFDRLARAYMDSVFRLALNYLKSPSEADDITQNVLIKLYRTDKEFESQAHIKNWLFRVTVNECKRAFLSPWRQTKAIEDYAEDAETQNTEKAARAILRLLSAVPAATIRSFFRRIAWPRPAAARIHRNQVENKRFVEM